MVSKPAPTLAIHFAVLRTLRLARRGDKGGTGGGNWNGEGLEVRPGEAQSEVAITGEDERVLDGDKAAHFKPEHEGGRRN